MKRLMFIINPIAGRGMYKNGLGEALRVLHSSGYMPTLLFTTYAGEAVELAARHGADYDIVCCMGGDGTLSDVVTGLMQIPSRPPIGYFPIGTANDIATTLKLPKNDPLTAAKLIVQGEPVSWDVGSLGSDSYFTYVAAFGAFTDVSYETPQQSKHALGQLAYLLEGMNRLPRLPHYKVRVELDGGRIFEDDYIFGGVTNSTSVAGLVKLPESFVSLDDGLFEISLVRYPGSLIDLNTLMAEVVSQNFDGKFFSITQSSKVRFTFEEPVPFTRDGEPGGIFTDVAIENINKAIRIIA